MPLLNTILTARSFRIHLLILAAVSLLCTQVPLLNYLGFEFSILIALLSSYGAGLLTLSIVRTADPATPAYTSVRIAASASLLLLIPPLLIIALNAFNVKNCSLTGGVVFYLLGPVPAVLFTVALAAVTSTMAKKWHKTLYTFLYLVILGHIVLVTMTTPRIFAFNPIVGFFPGLTYDESMNIEGELALFRIGTLAAVVVLVILAELIRRVRHKEILSPVRWPVETAFLLFGFAVLAGMFVYSDELGFSSSEDFIRKELGGEVTTEHFVITYPRDLLSADAIDDIAARHEFYFSIIARQFRSVPTRKIRSFLYESADQKGKLIGAAGTNIAKPWLWQLHINLQDIDRALKHELVHVMAAEFGFPVIRVGLNSGLIEGLAMAVERIEYDETLHRLAAQIFAIGLNPDVESLFSISGFLKSHGGTSYVLAGSFCRYLIDQYGMRRFRRLYRTGSFQALYNKDLSVLVAEWKRFVQSSEPSLAERTRAAYLFRRASIFGKECARVIAARNEGTRALLRQKQYAQAVESSRQSLELTQTPEAVLQHATALLRSGNPDEAIRFGEESLRDSLMAHVLLPLYLTLGDAYWSLGNSREANRLYEALYGIHLSPSYDEACAIRLAALRERDEAVLRPYILGDVEDSLRIGWLEKRMVPRQSLLVPYLLGRELMLAGRNEEASEILRSTGSLSVGVLEFFRLRRLARLSFETKQYQKAKVYFWESLNYTTRASHQFETEEWLLRCDWMEEKR